MSSNREKLAALGIKVDLISGNMGKVPCPKCGSTSKHKNKPDLSVKIEEGLYKCHNPGCDFVGSVIPGTKSESKIKEYVLPKFHNTTDLPEKAVLYFQQRGIGQITIKKLGIQYGKTVMPQLYGPAFKKFTELGLPKEEAERAAWNDANVNTIQFPYFRGDQLVNVKFRGNGKIFKLSKKAELIFHNLNSLKGKKKAIIVEGEFDTASWIEAGADEEYGIISVPNGAVKTEDGKKPDLEYLDNCIDWFQGIEEIIIATDNDEPGLFLREELARRLGYDRCFKIDFGDIKDSNDYLINKGPKELLSLLEKRKEFPLAGILNPEDMFEEVDYILENGLQRGDLTGFENLDELLSWVKGQFTIVTGIPNAGKSPLVTMIMISLSIRHGWKWGIFSPEHHPMSIFLVKMIHVILGKKHHLKPQEKIDAKQFIKDHFKFIAPERGNVTIDGILQLAQMLVVRFGICGLLIDPWNKIEHTLPQGMNETNFISRELDKIIDFDQKHGVHTILVAHPTKVNKVSSANDAEYRVVTLYDIAGSANFYNKPDNGISFHRNFSLRQNELYVQKCKYEHVGKQGKCFWHYNINNTRFTPMGTAHDNSNWLVPKAEQTDLFRMEPNIVVPSSKDNDEDVPF